MEPMGAKAPAMHGGVLEEGVVRRAEHLVMCGWYSQADSLLVKAWSAPTLNGKIEKDILACEAVLIFMRAGSYKIAGTWFERIAQIPADCIHWPELKRAVAQLCGLRCCEQPASPQSVSSSGRRPLLRAQQPTLPGLHITNLGTFRIQRDETLLPICTSQRAIAIFRYLLLQPRRTAHKEELMDLLWSDVSPRQATHSLHVAISTLRRYLDNSNESYIAFQNEQYQINPGATIADDCATFIQLSDAAEQHWRTGNHALARQTYDDAIRLYGGDYDTSMLDLPWAIVERERLLACYLTALDRVGRYYVAQQHFDLAIPLFQRLLERDNYREDAYYQIMFCYSQLGRRREALMEYQRCVAVLAQDLGVAPMPKIQALYRDILDTSPEHFSLDRRALRSFSLA